MADDAILKYFRVLNCFRHLRLENNIKQERNNYYGGVRPVILKYTKSKMADDATWKIDILYF